ncbi:MAG: iron-containing alcohol dehydrogenase [Candidatus Aenigmarchaeota archaeon]|nr:iron-containing alcohol dehydrogenase [Candidatus Aenigmarchaeota archaeon]
MVLIKNIDDILSSYNKKDFDYKKVIKRNNINVRFEKDDGSFKKELPKDDNTLLIITDPGFSGTYLKNLNKYKNAYIWTIEEESITEVEKIITAFPQPSKIMGFGGGRALDVAKMTAFRLEKPLISAPTAPSHDGLIAKNCALKMLGKKKSFSTGYPMQIIVPEHLWASSGDLKRAGAIDIASNVVSLQDVSLSMKQTNFLPDYEHMTYSLLAVRKILEEQTMNSLAEALIMSGLAMDKHSNYCSGSEHEVEKAISASGLGNNGPGTYLHGQLAGTGALIAAKIYEMYADRIPDGLFFDKKMLYGEIRRLFHKYDVLQLALKPLIEKRDVIEKILKNLSAVRPERYTLWNIIDSKEVNWKQVLDEIMDEN